MSFHPDKNMPGCMMPDGGNACLGYATLRDEWNRQRWRIKAMEEALWTILTNTEEDAIPHIAYDGMTAYQALAKDIADCARAGLAP